MINSNDILTRLQNGENIDTIAKEFTDALNLAKDVYDKETAVNSHKEEDMQYIIDTIADFIIAYYCETEEEKEEVNKYIDDIKPKEMIEMLDKTSKNIATLIKSVNELEKGLDNIKITVNSSEPVKMPNWDNFIRDFFKKNLW